MQLQQPQQPVDPRLHGAQSVPPQPGWTGPPTGGYVPYNDLQSRLMALAYLSRVGVYGMATYGIVAGVAMGLLLLPLLFMLTMTIVDFHEAWYVFEGYGEAWAAIGIAVGSALVIAGGGLGYYMTLRSLKAHFYRAHGETLDLLQNTELPLLIADEGYCAGLLDTLSSQNRFLFTGPPSIRRLEDQLSIAACYVRALRSGRFLADEVSPALLKHGSGRWWTTTPSARTLNLLASLSFCMVNYCGCLFMIPLARNVLVLSEQRGTLVAVCEYFAGAHEDHGG